MEVSARWTCGVDPELGAAFGACEFVRVHDANSPRNVSGGDRRQESSFSQRHTSPQLYKCMRGVNMRISRIELWQQDARGKLASVRPDATLDAHGASEEPHTIATPPPMTGTRTQAPV